jgi:hypothetical protein
MSDESLRELFRELREEPMAADSLARVRTGVRSRIAARRTRFFAFLALAPVAMALIAFFALTPRRPSDVPWPPLPPLVTAPAILDRTQEEAPSVPRTSSIARRKRKEPEKPVLIRIETPDPEVVILLVGN